MTAAFPVVLPRYQPAAAPSAPVRQTMVTPDQVANGLAIARNVHYVDGLDGHGTPVCRPALLVEIEDASAQIVTLTVFLQEGDRPDNRIFERIPHVRFKADAHPVGTWHWPERA